jgi:signal transduction histidine kinase
MIKMDKYQMGRVVENLVKNARQAIIDEARGIIKIKMETRPDDVIISVQDNGVGIDPAQKDRIFMPNFTTKSFGMGLGLYISRNIILSHGGEIDFSTEPGSGTIFTVRLPKN